jgi:hypothetical protein
VGLDEAAAGGHAAAHQHVEGAVGLGRILDVTRSTVRLAGFIVVSHSCSSFISPSPL